MPTRFFGGPILLALALLPADDAFAQRLQKPLGDASDVVGPSSAQSAVVWMDDRQYEAARDSSSNLLVDEIPAPRFEPRFDFDAIFGDRRGLGGNDYSISGFLPWQSVPGEHVLFAAVRATANDTGNIAGSLGFGERYYLEGADRIAGVSAWCDVDDRKGQTWYRAGGQFEVIGRLLELRGGADVVVGSKQWTVSSPTGPSPEFVGRNIAFRFHRTTERAYDQGYFELGGPLPLVGRYGLSGYAGGYYLWHSEAEGVAGWQARAAAAVTNHVELGARASRDDLFGFNAAISVALSVPTGGLKRVFRSILRGQSNDVPADGNRGVEQRDSIAGQLVRGVIRDFRVPVHRSSAIESVLAIDPHDDRPYVVIHVDPNASADGDGAFENPYRSLEAARLANDADVQIVRVLPRSDGAGTNLAVAAPFALFPGQRLLAASVRHQLATTEGLFDLPGFTAGPAPRLTNSMTAPSAVVRMVDDTEVSGFRIDGSGRHVGLQGNIHNFNLNRNTITHATDGVQMANARGLGLIEDNHFIDNLHDGVNVTVAGDSLELVIAGNSASGNGGDALDVSVTGGDLDLSASGNQFGGSGEHGIRLTSRSHSIITATLRGNQLGETDSGVGGNGGDGFRFDADSGFASLVIGGPDTAYGNVVQGNGDGSLTFDLTGSAVATVDEQNNILPDPAGWSPAFDIVIDYGAGLTAAQRAAFAAAEARWESIIVGELANVGSIDDVHIFAAAEVIDGAGGTLGEAAPTGLRAGSFLPFQGMMRFDEDDLAALQASGKLEDVILHEMAHVLGFGSIWQQLGLVSGAGGAEPRFTGPQATAEHNARFGTTASGVPLETAGGPGSVESHWLESLYADELMTPIISGVFRPISRTTIAQFADLGYVTDISQADP